MGPHDRALLPPPPHRLIRAAGGTGGVALTQGRVGGEGCGGGSKVKNSRGRHLSPSPF